MVTGGAFEEPWEGPKIGFCTPASHGLPAVPPPGVKYVFCVGGLDILLGSLVSFV